MKFLLLTALLSFSAMAQVPQSCRLNLRPVGIYYNQCPRTLVATGTDVWVGPGPHPMASVRVACADPQIVCVNKLKKDLRN